MHRFVGGGMARYRNLGTSLALIVALITLAGCSAGPAVTGSFDRNYTVNGPSPLELSNASGDVSITGSADGKVHVHGDVRASGFGFDNPQKRLDDTLSNPPVEQRGDTIRVGKDMTHMRNINIAYTIQVPHDTEVSATVASGAQTIRELRGPVKAHAASGSIRVEKIDRDPQLTTSSGSVSATAGRSDIHVTSASGSVTISNVKGDVRVSAISGVIRISQPNGPSEPKTATAHIQIPAA